MKSEGGREGRGITDVITLVCLPLTAEMLKAGLAMRLYTTYQVVCSFLPPLPPAPPPVSMGSVGESGRGRVCVSQREYRAPILEGSLLVPPYI